MQENKSFLKQIAADFELLSTGNKGAIFGFIFALLIVIFGFWKTLFILVMTIIGYFIGVRLFARFDNISELLDKIFPPGFFR